MWIVSQEGDKVINSNNILGLDSTTYTIYAMCDSDKDIALGEYKSRGRKDVVFSDLLNEMSYEGYTDREDQRQHNVYKNVYRLPKE